jgi:hypothetical protein
VVRDSVGADGFSMFGVQQSRKGRRFLCPPFFLTKPKQAVLELHLNPESKPIALIVIHADPVVERPGT